MLPPAQRVPARGAQDQAVDSPQGMPSDGSAVRLAEHGDWAKFAIVYDGLRGKESNSAGATQESKLALDDANSIGHARASKQPTQPLVELPRSTFRKRCDLPGNIPDHPVSDVRRSWGHSQTFPPVTFSQSSTKDSSSPIARICRANREPIDSIRVMHSLAACM